MKKDANQKYFVIGLSVLGAALVFGLLFGLNNLTGSTISVLSYGVSDELRSLDAGKIQTYVELDRIAARKLSTDDGKAEIAEEILKGIDLTGGLTTIYQNNPPLNLPARDLELVALAANTENDNFRNNQLCLNKIAINSKYRSGFKLALISELKYEHCNKRYLSVYAMHTFYNYENNGYICSESGPKLFLVNQNTGEVTTDVSNC